MSLVSEDTGIMLTDFIPEFCAGCGEETNLTFPLQRSDYIGHASHTCRRCGIQYQMAGTMALLKVAGEEGDLPKHYRGQVWEEE